MRELKKKKISKSLLLRLSLLVFVLYMVVTLLGQQAQIREKRRELDALDQQIVLQKLSNEETMAALESDDTAYIERIAREEFDYAKPGERVFINIAGE